MSRDWRVQNGVEGERSTTEEMRLFCQRPGARNADGKPMYKTEQSHKKECDVNEIIRKYDRTGLVSHISRFEARFGDLTGIDFKTAMDTVVEARALFDSLPAKVRKRFSNSPEELLRFMEDPSNRAEAIALGLIEGRTPPEKDGLGEHVKDGNVSE